MRTSSALLGFSLVPLLALAPACSGSGRAAGDSGAVTADELAEMAAPGVDETALDRTADPCQDFYQFACGGYIASLPADTHRQIRSFTELQQANNALLQQVFTALLASPRSDDERNAAALYKSCMASGDQATAAST